MNIWIQRLNPAIQNLWEVGNFFNTDGLDAGFVQRLLRPTSRNLTKGTRLVLSDTLTNARFIGCFSPLQCVQSKFS